MGLFNRNVPQNPIRHDEHIRRIEAIREVNPDADATIVATCLEVSKSEAKAYLKEIGG
jgi:2-methylisocitrate lyase-like PEP mutase family enzyme